ncbi:MULTISPECIES: dihydroxyacetone kinase subunit DhaK [Nostocales]|uniref:phosphoenolpyruvate--glycerone phosphotransferase n=3 Tax=Nostocales TaxID=1161 RepID=A0A0C1R078_9CYAN|nr:dihydroxyacetone kinase subunit DhaK [Tolypothrix bouteillei]KAF3885027.1 dihydroxyacetone kinase subunit DhaK [Tolypothrix bouteillei VB521301]
MKKLINKPEDFVRESLEGMAIAYPDLIKVECDPTFVYRVDAPIPGKVAIISGGGSGHEPMHAGFVGMGMLDAACPGEVFTSPTPDQMLAAAKKVDGGAGILYIVKNYSGDVMNFEMATELARSEGIRVLNILIDDDVAVKDSLYTQGRRGVGTTVLAEKIGGAAAQQGYDLQQVVDLCRQVNLNGRSMGIALSSCTVPAKGTPTFELGDREIEMGIGIHGEPGRERRAFASVDEITEMLAISIIEDTPYSRTVREWDEEKGEWADVELIDPVFQHGDRVLAFVNGMGGTPLSELYLVYRKLAEICKKKGLHIVRNLIGSYITSLEMQGCSISLLKVNDEMIRLWDAPVKTPSLQWGV